MELYFLLKDDYYDFTISFYLLEKNRTFDIPKRYMKKINNEYMYILPTIIAGKYSFFSSLSVNQFKLRIESNNSTLYNSNEHKKKHTFELRNINSQNSSFECIEIDETEFNILEKNKKQHTYIIRKKLWNYYWYNIHYFTRNYYPPNPSDDDKAQIRKLITVMKTSGIPCQKCKFHFNAYLTKYPIDDSLESKELLHKYFIDLHNTINKKNCKREFTYDQVEKLYEMCPLFEEDLMTVCKPLYRCFQDGNAYMFPNILNSKPTINKLEEKFIITQV